MSKPQWTRTKVESILSNEFQKANRKRPKVCLLGVRGYYSDSMGEVGKNDRGIYDDAMFLVSPTHFESFNFNTDPSRKGINADTGKGYAELQVGIYDYKIGIHGLNKPKAKQYMALVQAGRVRICRDHCNEAESGFYGINIHRGGASGTSSLGCQTVVRDQWNEFFEALEKQLDLHNQNIVPYCLIEQNG